MTRNCSICGQQMVEVKPWEGGTTWLCPTVHKMIPNEGVPHCPKCLSLEIEQHQGRFYDWVRCRDCDFIFSPKEILVGVDPIV